MRRSQDAIKRWNAEVIKAHNYASNNPLKNGKTIKLENITVLSDNATEDIDSNAICPFLGHGAWVNTEGRFSPCCAPDELRKSLGDFGNLTTKKMQDIWQSDEYEDLKKNYMKHSLCKSCNMRKPSQDVQTPF
jgi:radical SAM protein with 4Fe4S-binding SPASM domain